ncbi:hypothetical protein FJY69_04025, partial [candidate division WOR-3 bacterium]|nr:hypothetical protein [candidate division WOR-3 bacterium]
MKTHWSVLSLSVWFSFAAAAVNSTPGGSSDNLCIRDVTVVAIVAPRDTVDPGVTLTPRAIVRNLGELREVFPVTMQVANGYNQTRQCTLQVGQTDTVAFAPNWVAHPTGAFATACFTSLAGDRNRRNDTIRGSVEVLACRHDVGVLAILAPQDTVDSGSVHTPSAVIHNFGDRRETFPVSFRIGTGYAETVQRTLDTGATDTVRFPDWVAEPVGPLAMQCFTELGNDADRSNDTAKALVTVEVPRLPDVGAVSVIWPFGLVDSGSAGVPRALVTNCGNREESFQVAFRIGTVYRDSTPTQLAPGETTEVRFSAWIAQPVGHHEVLCFTQLADDRDRSNDTARTELCVVPPVPPRRDVGAVEILSPVGSVVLGTTVAPRARVGNFGDSTEVFPVTLEIEPDYSTTVICTLAPARTTLVDFPTWIAGPLGRQATTCHTSLGPDADRSNDTVRNSVQVVEPDRRDVGVLAIIAPPDTVDSGSTHTPSAKLTNFGNRAETFPVTFTIGSVYSHTLPSVTLNPGDTTTLYFQSWTAARPGSFAALCYSALTSDQDRSNDTAYRTVTVVDTTTPARHDVGVLAIHAPPDTVDSASTHTPSAKLANFGNRTETFPVTFAIGSVYSHTLPSVTLNPGDTTTLFFSPWTAAQTGSFATVCYTSLAQDENRSNDTAHGAVVVRPPRYDVGAIAIVAPADTVDSGTVITPVAVIHRFADDRTLTPALSLQGEGQPEVDVTFPVTMAIGGAYRQTVQVTMPARGIDTVRFDPAWIARPVGAVGCTCYASLTGDPNRSNDTAYGMVVVLRPAAPARHDVGVLAVL